MNKASSKLLLHRHEAIYTTNSWRTSSISGETFFKRNSGICLQSSMLLLLLKSSGKEATLNLKQPKLWSFKFSSKTLFNAVITK